jgi:ribonuclease HI
MARRGGPGPEMPSVRAKLFFDGGCRPNPGPIEAAVVVRGAVHLFEDLGHGDNRDAEWLALLRAAAIARTLGLERAVLIGDAAEVIAQAGAVLKGASPMHAHAAAFQTLAAAGPPLHVRWIRRAQNLAGIALAARHPR